MFASIWYLVFKDMTSDMIAKMLPGEIPPWQISVITGIDKSYLLVRLHHLYMSEEGVSLCDILSIKQNTWESSPVLDGVFRPPVVIPRVNIHYIQINFCLFNLICL